jgi:hypothetical protein
MITLRRTVYAISALATGWFFLFPQPWIALSGALFLQTLAYTTIAGKSAADGIILSGISLLLIGCLPGNHPLIRGPFFETVRLWIIAGGTILLLSGLLVLALNRCGRCRAGSDVRTGKATGIS